MQHRVDGWRKSTRVYAEIAACGVTEAKLCRSIDRHQLEGQHRRNACRLQRPERRRQAQQLAGHSLNDATMIGLAVLTSFAKTTAGLWWSSDMLAA